MLCSETEIGFSMCDFQQVLQGDTPLCCLHVVEQSTQCIQFVI